MQGYVMRSMPRIAIFFITSSVQWHEQLSQKRIAGLFRHPEREQSVFRAEINP
jgi:hypothetical protein